VRDSRILGYQPSSAGSHAMIDGGLARCAILRPPGQDG
jgi:hypothetical protein